MGLILPHYLVFLIKYSYQNTIEGNQTGDFNNCDEHTTWLCYTK